MQKRPFFSSYSAFGSYNLRKIERSRMIYNKKQYVISLALAGLAIFSLIGCKKKPQNEGQKTDPPSPRATEGGEQKKEWGSATAKQAANPTTDSKPTLSEIIDKSKSWEPAFIQWYGKESPDFTVTDLNGKKHTLSEYRGRNVMLVFWATWCGPCIKEIPYLIELRDTISEDKLVILAISYIGPRNPTETVKKFVSLNRVINYPVISVDAATLPQPYKLAYTIPCSFFIDPQGRIKLATEGMIPLEQMKAIIEADR
jgi:thiol-disulfide isomerase/thioredoxin